MSFGQPLPQVRPLVVFGILVVALALQTTSLNALTIGGIKADLVLVVVLCVALLAGPAAGAIYGAIGGLMEGYLQGSHLGVLGVTRALAAFLVGTIEMRVAPDRVVIPAATVLAGSLVAHGLYFLMAPEFPIGRPMRIAIAESLLNMVFAPVAYSALARWALVKRR